MSWLLDTNILLRLEEKAGRPTQRAAAVAVSHLHSRGEVIFTTPQNFIEFWSVATRPVENNGLGLPPAEVAHEIARLHEFFPLAPDAPPVYLAWRHLVVLHQIKGTGAHDARLVAVMLVHGLTHLLTFNVQDFKRYPEINAVHPKEVR